ncbi:MAG: Gx transporter family protein [Evtepia sp.]
MLSAVAMIVFVIEAQVPVPIPIPGVKLGLANVITLFALRIFGRRAAGMVLLVRIVLGNLVIGQLMAMLYSLAGGVLCWLVMSLLTKFMSQNQIWILSIFGSIAHNVGQLAVAVWITGTPSILVYAPVLLLIGMVTGFFTGKCAQYVIIRMQRLRSSCQNRS